MLLLFTAKAFTAKAISCVSYTRRTTAVIARRVSKTRKEFNATLKSHLFTKTRFWDAVNARSDS
jgi:hypothetical protein